MEFNCEVIKEAFNCGGQKNIFKRHYNCGILRQVKLIIEIKIKEVFKWYSNCGRQIKKRSRSEDKKEYYKCNQHQVLIPRTVHKITTLVQTWSCLDRIKLHDKGTSFLQKDL